MAPSDQGRHSRQALKPKKEQKTAKFPSHGRQEEDERLDKKLRQAKLIIGVRGKVSQMLGNTLETKGESV